MKGQGIYAFVTLVDGVPYSEELRKSLILTVRNQVCLGPFGCSFSIVTRDNAFHFLLTLRTSSKSTKKKLNMILSCLVADWGICSS